MSKIPNLKEAEELLSKYVKEDFLMNHSKIVSGIMGYYAKKSEPEQEEYWKITGLLHDIDFELYPEEHCKKCVEILKEENIDEGIIKSIVSHGYDRLDYVENIPESLMEKTLFAIDELSGLIGACAMVRPSKSISDMDLKSLKKKYKTANFAAGCSRENIEKGAEMLGVSVEELMNETLEAMKSFDNIYNM